MNIRDLLNEKKVIVDLQATDKKGIIRELAALLATKDSNINLDLLVEKLIEREALSSTGIGDGIAIPHCKYRNIDGIMMSFGMSGKGVDFDSIDKKPVNLIFLLIAPDTPKAAGEHLRTLAKITRVLKGNDFRKRLLSATTEKDVYKIIAEEDEKY